MSLAFPRIGIVGSGSVGLYFGARLAMAGADVRFLMRGDLPEVLARGSVRVEDVHGESLLKPVHAVGRPQEIGEVDLVIVALKTTVQAETASLVGPMLGSSSVILTLQNGFGGDEHLASLFGAERIMGGLVFMAINRIGAGQVRVYGKGSVAVGEFRGGPTDRTRALVTQFGAARLYPHPVDNLHEARWRKLIWNIPFNGLSIARGKVTTDRICSDPAMAREVMALMSEVQGAAAAFGFNIPDAFLKKQFEATPPMGPYRPSSLVDFESGREVEVESIWGEPLRRARGKGLEMPLLGALYGELKALCPQGSQPTQQGLH